MGGDRLAAIVWACLSFILTKDSSEGFDSTATLPNFGMLVAIFEQLINEMTEMIGKIRLNRETN
jgi:hypothetical protein